MYEAYVEIESNNAYWMFLELLDDGSNWCMSSSDDFELFLSKKFIDLEDARYVTDRLVKKLSTKGQVRSKIVEIIDDWSTDGFDD